MNTNARSCKCDHFLEVVKRGSLTDVRFFGGASPDKNVKNEHGNNAIFLAISHSRPLEIFKVLVEEIRVDILAVNEKNQDVFDMLRSFPEREDVTLYLSNKAKEAGR